MKFLGTSGEWKVTEPGEMDGTYQVISGKTVIFKVYGDGQAEANAHLGAASKNLLAACKHALDVFEKRGIKKPSIILKAVNKAHNL